MFRRRTRSDWEFTTAFTIYTSDHFWIILKLSCNERFNVFSFFSFLPSFNSILPSSFSRFQGKKRAQVKCSVKSGVSPFDIIGRCYFFKLVLIVQLVAIVVLNLLKTCFNVLIVGNTENQPGPTEYCGMNQRKRKTPSDWSVTRHSRLTKQVITDLLVLHFCST